MAYNNETGMWEGYIYKIVNDINDHIYIGQTMQTIQIRFWQHKTYAKRNPQLTSLCKAMNKYGIDNFHSVELEKYANLNKSDLKEILNEREIYLIDKYKRDGIILYNMTIGGDNAGNTYPEKSVIQYDLFCNEINRYNSIMSASEKTLTNHSDISACCKKNKNIFSANNYIWRYESEPLTKDEIDLLHKKFKGCKQYDFDGNLINVFYTINDAVIYLKNLGINAISSNIGKCCRGNSMSSIGFVWRYYLDGFNKYPVPEKYKKVEQRDIYTGKLIQTFESYIDAGNKLGFDKNIIYQCCENNNHSCNGYTWCYAGDFTEDALKQMLKKPVKRYNKNLEYIDMWNSITEASKFLHINSGTIGSVCRNNAKTAGGFVWRYAYDDISTYLYK